MVEFTFKIRCAGSKDECDIVEKQLQHYFTTYQKIKGLYEHEGKINKQSYLEARRLAHKIRKNCFGMISAIDFNPS